MFHTRLKSRILCELYVNRLLGRGIISNSIITGCWDLKLKPHASSGQDRYTFAHWSIPSIRNLTILVRHVNWKWPTSFSSSSIAQFHTFGFLTVVKIEITNFSISIPTNLLSNWLLHINKQICVVGIDKSQPALCAVSFYFYLELLRGTNWAASKPDQTSFVISFPAHTQTK